MKGKVFSLKIVLTLLVLLTASFCFGIGILPKSKSQVYAASTKVSLNTGEEKEEYSAIFAGNLIFSVEKVLTSDSYTDNTSNVKKMFGTNADIDENGEKGKNFGEDKTYYFKDIQNGTQNKTVVDNGQFIILNNELPGGNLVAPGKSDEKEAIMVSFGAYVYSPDIEGTNDNEENVEIADEIDNEKIENSEYLNTLAYSPISYLEVSLEKDGEKQILPNNRNINLGSTGLFFDFVCVIDQKTDGSNEGYYKFTVNYMVGNVEYEQSFEFYVVNELSYIQDLDMYYAGYGYSAKPTLGWMEDGDSQFEKTTQKDGYVRYFIGQNGYSTEKVLSYPTITYDYTKYNLSFTHTANQKNTVYDFTRQFNKTLTSQTAQLNYTITSSSQTISDFIELSDYSVNSSINLVTIVLTEPGTYTFSYDLIYDGYNAETAPNVEIEKKEIKLAIHGLSAQYSKTDYEGAQMQYFDIATKVGNHVDLFIPHGYNVDEDISDLIGQELGFVYKLVESEDREGNIDVTSSSNSLINDQLKNDNTTYGIYSNAYQYLINNTYLNAGTINSANYESLIDIESSLNQILSKVAYAQTNQGSIWISGNDQYTTNSFYFQSPTRFTASSMFGEKLGEDGKVIADTYTTTAKTFTNTTSFNSKGYYLVFLEIKPNGITEKQGESSANFWQIFAFQYTSSSVDIKIETEDGDIIAGGKYTNENVTVSWKKPGIFDREISGYFYSITNNNATREQLLATTKRNLNTTETTIGGIQYFTANLGEDVQDDSFVKYLIRLESEGESATHKIFTIDRQDISGVQPYLIQEMYSGNSVFYSYATDLYNNIIPINNSITDSYATIRWDDKASGAGISATYSFTPFVQNGDEAVATTGTNGKTWITTNYELGTTILGSSLNRSSLDNYNISSDSILFNQGIYIIHIKDDAGNECYYTFVIDRTENHFQIDNRIVSNTSVIFGDNVSYSIGDYKAFELSTTNEDLNSFIEKASAGTVSTFKNDLYYTGTYSNQNIITNYFQKSGGKYYFTVKNNNVVGYDTADKVDNSISGTKGELLYSVDGESYYKRTLYAVAENQAYSIYKIVDSSYVTVEINKDNARGMVYYSSTQITDIPLDGANSDSIKRLDTGSDMVDENDVKTSGMVGARATSSSHVAFVWNMGTGKFEVSQVYYTFYSLKPTQFNAEENGKYYFYGSGETYEIYNNGWIDGKDYSLGDGRAVISFNGAEESRAGLYVVTRVYKTDSEDTDLGDDVAEKNYYFIVDRNEIIDLSQGIGGSIKLGLLEDEIPFSEFSTKNTNTGILSVTNDVYDQRYNLYLRTTKLPATINVPIGKYLDEEQISDYYAGRLNVQVYFNDVYGQLTGAYKNRGIKIFDSTYMSLVENDVFEIDVYSYLSSVNAELRDRITESSDNGIWLFLSGDYIIKITDNVVDELGNNHTKWIGFRIEGYEEVGPQIETFTGFSEESLAKIITNDNGNFTYSATVSQEYLQVVLPKYVDNITEKAQVDPNYLVVKQFYGTSSAGIDYINYPYEHKGGYNLKDYTLGVVSQNDDGSISVLLDTKLRTADGKIDLANLNTPLKYTITVRYKIGDDEDPDKYQNCYVYYDTNGKPIEFYYATYTITIDREAPSANIEALNNSDALVGEYNEMFGMDSMIENGVHETSSYLYFTKQYAKYYQEEKSDKGYIYAYQVYKTIVDEDGNVVQKGTEFITDDVYKVYYKKISENSLADLKSYNLTLPMIDESKYDGFKYTSEFVGYEGLGLSDNNYYEIIEQDHAGNITQYVIHYEPGELEIDLQISFSTTGGETVNFEWEDKTRKDIYDLTANGTSSVSGAQFIKIEVQRLGVGEILQILTTATTNFEKLNQQIVKAITDEEFGNFNLVVTHRTISGVTSNTININLYDINEDVSLDIEKLVEVVDGVYYINLWGANVPDEENNLWYFATEITVRKSSEPDNATIYVAEMNKDYIAGMSKYEAINYFDKTNGYKKVDGLIPCSSDTTYYLTMKDVINPNKPTPHRFNTSGRDFYDIEFKNAFSDNYDESYYLNNGVYYGYTTARIEYDKTYYAILEINENGRLVKKIDTRNNLYISSDSWSFNSDGTNYNEIYLHVDHENEDVYIEATITIFELITENGVQTESNVRTYNVIINTELKPVYLKDDTGELKDIIKIYHNLDYTDGSIGGGNASGYLTLSWSKVEENSYFDYEYRLYELLNDGTYRIGSDGNPGLDLTDKTSHNILTATDSLGIYKFEIKIYGKDGIYLGNRIYAFEVNAESTELYEVRFVNDKTKFMEEPSSSFKIANDIPSLTLKIKGYFPNIREDINFPLYIANQELEVVLRSSRAGIEISEKILIDDQLPNYGFYMYEISKKDEFKIYIGILEVNEKSKLVNNVNIISGAGSQLVTDLTSLTISGGVDDEVRIKSDIIPVTSEILKKNILEIEVYYNGVKINSFDYNGNYVISGNGKYLFEIKDLAGNVHKFDNGESKLDVYVLREVVKLVNDEAPIDNAVYNDAVSVTIFSSTKYVTGSISVVAEKNGEPYSYKGNNPYVFSDYGTYRVTITAKYNDGNETPIPLTKVVTFTIINVKEARKSIDLTSLSGCKITKVINTYGEDKTQAFLTMMNTSGGGMNITYNNVMSYENNPDVVDKLNVTAGKITFTMTYVVSDGVYPDRTVDFSFTLNDESPVIECSLDKGDSTTKDFKIYFNPAILYAQIGEAYIYINDELVAHIDENSANTEVSVKTSYNSNGDGDYYIKLVGTSGVVWDSFKVTIKEPLNFWAIVVIIVIVGVVATVVITVIVLRRKMRIR